MTQILEYNDPQWAFTKQNWHRANRDIIAKILTECVYEELLEIDTIDSDKNQYCIKFPSGDGYQFSIKKREFFGYVRILPDSLVQLKDDSECAFTDAYDLLQNINEALGVKPDTAAHAIREFSNTLLGDLHQLASTRLTNAELLVSDERIVESQLVAHPWIIANKGRLGFNYSDYLKYAPELAKDQSLLWIAVARGSASFQSISQLDYEAVVTQELSADELTEFVKILENHHLKASQYFFMPVHPWQWDNEIVSLFAREIIHKRIVFLGKGEDRYQAQQSIRTFSNCDNIKKFFVKLPISILNTSVYRGIPSERVKIAPTLSQWLLDEVANDPFLRDETRFILLGEVATINYDHPIYSKLKGAPYQFKEKLAVIWRESIHTKLDADERCIPLAALLHLDKNSQPFIGALIEDSGLTPEAWARQFLKVTLEPLLHVLYKFGFVFSPHGQNALIVLKNSIPTRLAIKDFVDDANMCADPLPEQQNLPEELEDILEYLEGPILIQWIQSGLFVCVFRYLTEILQDFSLLSERRFWELTYETIKQYQIRFPDLEERFEAFDLLRPSFPKLCLNRVRLIDKGYADNAERPSAAIASMLDNPLGIIKNEYDKNTNNSEVDIAL